HTRFSRDWSSDVCSSDLRILADPGPLLAALAEAGVLTEEWCSRNASGGGVVYANREEAEVDRDEWNADLGGGVDDPPRSPVVARSEERRVGKTSTCRGGR